MSKYTTEQLQEMIEELNNQLDLNKVKDAELYPKLSDDKLNCKLCGGKYTRQNRRVHERTKKHIAEVNHIRSMRALLNSKKIDGR